MQEQKKANVLPGQVTLEDVIEQETVGKPETEGLIEIEVRIPGEKPELIRTRSYCISYIDAEAHAGRNSFCAANEIDTITLLCIEKRNIKKIERECPELVEKLYADKELAEWLDSPYNEDEEESV